MVKVVGLELDDVVCYIYDVGGNIIWVEVINYVVIVFFLEEVFELFG